MPPKEREFLLILLCILAFFFFPGRRGREEVEEGSALEFGGDTTNQPATVHSVWGGRNGGTHKSHLCRQPKKRGRADVLNGRKNGRKVG